MPKGAKRGREEAESYDSDGGFVENDSEDGAPKKKTKRTAAPTKTHDDGDEKCWELSSGRAPRRVALSNFKGAHLINIREFYEKDEQFLPGKKGISLNIDQYKAFLKAIPEINASLKEVGVDLSGAGGDEEEDVGDVQPKKKKTAVKKESKANIDATSDEEE